MECAFRLKNALLKTCFFFTLDININADISDNEEIKTLYFIDELNTQNTLESNHLYLY